MKNISRNLVAATLAGSLTLAGTSAAVAEEAKNNCESLAAEFTATVEGKEHTFKQQGTFSWVATDDESVKLTRAEVSALAQDNPEICAPATDLEGWGPSEGGPGKVEDDDENPGTPDDGKKPGTPDDGKNPGTPDDGKKPGNDGDDNKEKSSFDDFKSKLSSEEGKPTDLGIAAIVLGVLGAIAAVAPAAAKALGIKLPF